MDRFNGFDRIATEEELHQVLAVLRELEQDGWVFVDSDAPQEHDFCDDVPNDPTDVEALAALAARRPELKN